MTCSHAGQGLGTPSLATVLDVPRPATGHTFIARARVPHEKWERFAEATAAQGTDRSKVINEFVDWYLRERGATLPSRPERAAPNKADK